MSEIKFNIDENETAEIQEESQQSSFLMGSKQGSSCVPSFLWWRISNLFVFIFFSLATYVQLNDEDACLWVLLYIVPTMLSAAVVCYPVVSDHHVWQGIAIVHTASSILMLIYLAILLIREMFQPGSDFSLNLLEYEEGREFLGVVLVVTWLKLCRLDPLIEKRKEIKEPPLQRLLTLMIIALVPMALWGVCFVDGIKQRLGHCKAMYGSCNNHLTMDGNPALDSAAFIGQGRP